MCKLIAIIAALGLFGVTSLSPVYAATKRASGDYQTKGLLYLGSKGKKAKAAVASPTKKPAEVKKTK
jgi:hypothetical protein